VLPRLTLGALSALFASLLALAIPLVLEQIVQGPIASGDVTAIWWGAGAILLLGLAEAGMVWLRRWFVLAPATLVEYDLRQTFTPACSGFRSPSTTAGSRVSCSAA
jgi:ATP-binding cassette subfamily B protein